MDLVRVHKTNVNCHNIAYVTRTIDTKGENMQTINEFHINRNAIGQKRLAIFFFHIATNNLVSNMT